MPLDTSDGAISEPCSVSLGDAAALEQQRHLTPRGTHSGELRGLPPTGNRVEWELIDIFRVRDGRLLEHWTHMDFEALRMQMRPRE